MGNIIEIPDWCKRVNIDVGTSVSAPYSEYWLSNDSELAVFAFEPNVFNYHSVIHGPGPITINGKTHVAHNPPGRLNSSRIGKSFFIENIALGNEDREIDFFCTSGDSGTSSMYEPNEMNVLDVTKVQMKKLSSFFKEFPWEKIPFISLLKIDAQGADFDIVKGCESFLKDRVATLIVETTVDDHYKIKVDQNAFKDYIMKQGFVMKSWDTDGSFFNEKFEDESKTIDFMPR